MKKELESYGLALNEKTLKFLVNSQKTIQRKLAFFTGLMRNHDTLKKLLI